MMIRATEEEKNIAKSKAQDMGMNLSAFVRFLIRNWDSPETHQNQRQSLWERIGEVLYALYLKVRR